MFLNENYRLTVECLYAPAKLQFTAMSVNTQILYVVKTLQDFKKWYKVYFGGEMEVTSE